MEEKKLNDKEIIKALKFAIAQGEPDGIGFWNNGMKWCEFSMCDVLDLIQRLQAEKKELQESADLFNHFNEKLNRVIAEQKAEIERLKDENRQNLFNSNTRICELDNEKAELQKQVDELTIENEAAQKALNNYLKPRKEIEQQAVKDTAKEILEEIRGYYPIDLEHCNKGEAFILKLCYELAERYGVEVE